MNLRQSISHPELLIDEDGSVFKNGQRITIIRNHETTMRGPIIAYRHEGRIKQLSVLRLVYEAHVKRSKIESGDFIELYDGDEMNIHASNIFTGRRYSRPIQRAGRKKQPPKGEPYSVWMNGIGELYC